jgi:hypothetical protein
MERKILSSVGWNLNCVTPFAILHELLLSLGFPNPRTNLNYKRGIYQILHRVGVLISVLIPEYSLCALPPSILLLGVLEFQNLNGSLGKVGIDMQIVNKWLAAKQVIFY